MIIYIHIEFKKNILAYLQDAKYNVFVYVELAKNKIRFGPVFLSSVSMYHF